MSFKNAPKSKQDDDFDDAPANQVTVPAALLAEAVLGAALSPRLVQMLGDTTKPLAVIVRVPDVSWVAPIASAMATRFPHLVARSVLKKPRAGAEDVEMIKLLAHGRGFAAVTPDPEAMIDDSVLNLADHIIVVAPPSVELVRKLIGQVTGTRTLRRIMPADLEGLDFYPLAAALRPAATPAEIIERLRCMTKAKPLPVVRADVLDAGNEVPMLDRLPLTAIVRTWADRMLADLKAVKEGTLSPRNLQPGILEGPPGTGKSLLAESLAVTAGWTFIPTSMGDFFARKDGHLGSVVRNLSEFIDTLLATDFAVGFIDEADGIPNRAELDARDRQFWAPVVGQALTEIDRVRKSNRPVLLLGATNYYSRLDAALVRPGRLHRRIPVLPPSTDGEVVELLRYYVGGAVPLEDLKRIAQVGHGATPATVEGWITEAQGAARAEDRLMTSGDILAQAAPADSRSAADIRAAALHELGHAVVAHRVGQIVDRVSIVPSGAAGGHTETRMTTTVPTLEQLEAMVMVALAGRAADTVLGTGPSTGAETDLATATRLLAAARERQGLYGNLVVRSGGDLGLRSEQDTRAIDADLRRLLSRAIALVEADKTTILRLAGLLTEKLVLTGDEVVVALHRADIAAVARPKRLVRKGASGEAPDIPDLPEGPDGGSLA